MQPPTDDREAIVAAIDRIQLQRATATGSGLIVSLATLFPDAGFDVSTALFGRDAPRNAPIGEAKKDPKKDFKPVPPGSYNSAVIILLTDGQRTTGPDPIEVAKLAADRGVRVYTVGFGTTSGEIIGFEGWSFRVRLDEETLKTIATMTQGEYFYAGTAADLKKVYADPELAAAAWRRRKPRSPRCSRASRRCSRMARGPAVAALVQPDPLMRIPAPGGLRFAASRCWSRRLRHSRSGRSAHSRARSSTQTSAIRSRCPAILRAFANTRLRDSRWARARPSATPPLASRPST